MSKIKLSRQRVNKETFTCRLSQSQLKGIIRQHIKNLIYKMHGGVSNHTFKCEFKYPDEEVGGFKVAAEVEYTVEYGVDDVAEKVVTDREQPNQPEPI